MHSQWRYHLSMHGHIVYNKIRKISLKMHKNLLKRRKYFNNWMLRLVHKLRASRFSLKFLFLLCNNPSTSHVEIFNHNFNKNLSSLVNGWLMKVFEASSLSLKHCLSLECTLGNYRLLSLSRYDDIKGSLFSSLKLKDFFLHTHPVKSCNCQVTQQLTNSSHTLTYRSDPI